MCGVAGEYEVDGVCEADGVCEVGGVCAVDGVWGCLHGRHMAHEPWLYINSGSEWYWR